MLSGSPRMLYYDLNPISTSFQVLCGAARFVSRASPLRPVSLSVMSKFQSMQQGQSSQLLPALAVLPRHLYHPSLLDQDTVLNKYCAALGWFLPKVLTFFDRFAASHTALLCVEQRFPNYLMIWLRNGSLHGKMVQPKLATRPCPALKILLNLLICSASALIHGTTDWPSKTVATAASYFLNLELRL